MIEVAVGRETGRTKTAAEKIETGYNHVTKYMYTISEESLNGPIFAPRNHSLWQSTMLYSLVEPLERPPLGDDIMTIIQGFG